MNKPLSYFEDFVTQIRQLAEKSLTTSVMVIDSSVPEISGQAVPPAE